ncbi:MAG: hypothetical protein JRF05_04340, partial [Deltaproteobacteria bacterium]|nr:hypothetical protein [Deltaproteobacteria bacterium]
GLEQVDAGFYPVVKVETEHNGKVLERVPYFPFGTDDHERINVLIAKLLAKQAGESQ